jgi:hypothetical protein
MQSSAWSLAEHTNVAVEQSASWCYLLAVKARMSVTGRGRKGRMESMVHAAPVPVIEHVLHDIHTTGTYQGFPQLGG